MTDDEKLRFSDDIGLCNIFTFTLLNETPDYDARYQTETLSHQIESYDRYFNDGFDDQLLNINIPTVTIDYNRLLDDSFNNEIPKVPLTCSMKAHYTVLFWGI
uniref:Uncharacterized protein n=1 Tax=Glossina austeni TaxID=7395 RepID=A0A1A9V1Q7_GLOAU